MIFYLVIVSGACKDLHFMDYKEGDGLGPVLLRFGQNLHMSLWPQMMFVGLRCDPSMLKDAKQSRYQLLTLYFDVFWNIN